MDHAASLRNELVDANHILAGEGVLDAFGHVSARDPERPQEYLLSRAVSPESVSVADVLRFTLDSKPVDRRRRAATPNA
jgi:HCOMODA/2-hydroxy-3-carboxy-muconic semialdehyde decarboxylase